MSELLQQIKDVFLCVMPFNAQGKFVGFDSEGLIQTLSKPEITIFSMIALALIAFLETGLFVFFLPGDSLFVTAGLVAWNSNWPLYQLIPILVCAPILGDSVGYWIGRSFGPSLFKKEKAWLLKKKNYELAHSFFEKYGGKAIILAKFVPIARTFVPPVAGVSTMRYGHYLSYSIFGSILWITSMVLIGYALTPWLDPLLKRFLGPQFEILKHIEKVIIAVVIASVAIPAVVVGFKKKQETKTDSPVPTLNPQSE